MGKEKAVQAGDYEVVCQEWVEKERGWDAVSAGFSLHIDDITRARFISDYWDSLPDATPSVYQAPGESPYEVGVGIEVYAEVIAFGSLRYAADYKTPRP